MEKLARPLIRCLHNGFTRSNRTGFVHGTCLCMSLILWGPTTPFTLYFALTKGLWLVRPLQKQETCWSSFSVPSSFDKCFTYVLMNAFPLGIPSVESTPPCLTRGPFTTSNTVVRGGCCLSCVQSSCSLRAPCWDILEGMVVCLPADFADFYLQMTTDHSYCLISFQNPPCLH